MKHATNLKLDPAKSSELYAPAREMAEIWRLGRPVDALIGRDLFDD
jgi:hypothetical protein